MNRRVSFFGAFLLSILSLSSCERSSSPQTTSQVRVPQFNYAKDKEGGCGNVFLHKGSSDDLEVLWISAQKDKLKLPKTGSSTFDLANPQEGLQVAVDLWDLAPKYSAYCNDISLNELKKKTWYAKKGKLTLTILGPVDEPGAGPKRYKASAKLEGVVFQGKPGDEATLKEESISEVVIGWIPG